MPIPTTPRHGRLDAAANVDTNPKRLQYGVSASTGRYTLEYSVATTPSASSSVKTVGSVVFDLVPTEGRQRSFMLREMHAEIDAAGTKIAVRGSAAHFEMKHDGSIQWTLRPKEIGPTGMTLDMLFGIPTHTLTFSAVGPERTKPNAENGFVKLGLVDFAAVSLFFFPTLSSKRVQAGDSWVSTRTVPTSVNVTPAIQTEVTYSLMSFTRCGSQECAIIGLKTKTGLRDVKNKGRQVQVSYEFAGTLLFGVSSRLLESANVAMTMNSIIGSMRLPMQGRYRLTRAGQI